MTPLTNVIRTTQFWNSAPEGGPFAWRLLEGARSALILAIIIIDGAVLAFLTDNSSRQLSNCFCCCW